MDEFFSCDEDEDESDPRNTSVSSDRTLEPTPVTEQTLSEASTLLGCTPSEPVQRVRYASDRQQSRSSRDDQSITSSRRRSQSNSASIRESSFAEPIRSRKRPSNLPLSNICSPEPISTDSDKLEPYDEVLVHLNGNDLAELDNGETTGVTNKIVVANMKARLVSFEPPASEGLNDTVQDSSKARVQKSNRSFKLYFHMGNPRTDQKAILSGVLISTF